MDEDSAEWRNNKKNSIKNANKFKVSQSCFL